MARVIKISDQVAFFLLCVLLFDCASLGGGSFVKPLGIDYRMILFAAFFVASLPSFFQRLKKFFTNIYVMPLLLWAVWLFASAVRGVMRGNSVPHVIFGMIGFAAFGILPGTVSVLRDKRRIVILMRVIMVAAIFLALQILALLVLYQVDPQTFSAVNLAMIRLEFGGSTGVTNEIVRIFMRSSPYLVVACACGFYLCVTERRRVWWIACCLGVAVSIFSLVLSYTRSLYFCAFVTAFVLLLLLFLATGSDKQYRKKLMGTTVRLGAVALAVLLVCDVGFGARFASYGVYRATNIAYFNPFPESEEASPDVDEGKAIDEEDKDSDKDTDGGENDDKNDKTDKNDKDDKTDREDADSGADGNAEALGDLQQYSDDLRSQTMAEVIAHIKEHPWIGSGMGAVLTARENLDGFNEYFFLDHAYKVGMIGVLLYILPLLLMTAYVLWNIRKMGWEQAVLCSVWLACLIGFATFSWFNPYLNGSNGIAVYCCTIAVLTAIKDKNFVNGDEKPLKTTEEGII